MSSNTSLPTVGEELSTNHVNKYKSILHAEELHLTCKQILIYLLLLKNTPANRSTNTSLPYKLNNSTCKRIPVYLLLLKNTSANMSTIPVYLLLVNKYTPNMSANTSLSTILKNCPNKIKSTKYSVELSNYNADNYQFVYYGFRTSHLTRQQITVYLHRRTLQLTC